MNALHWTVSRDAPRNKMFWVGIKFDLPLFKVSPSVLKSWIQAVVATLALFRRSFEQPIVKVWEDLDPPGSQIRCYRC